MHVAAATAVFLARAPRDEERHVSRTERRWMMMEAGRHCQQAKSYCLLLVIRASTVS